MFDEKISNYGRIQTERNGRGAVLPYDRSVRHYGPGDAPLPRSPHQCEKIEVFDGPIPERWTAEHVGRRLVDAFNILHRMPPLPRPSNPGNAMPDVVRDVDDVRAKSAEDRWEELMRLSERPTHLEITRMEGALEWLRQLKAHDSGMALQLMHWANQIARHRSIRRLCIQQRWCPSVFYRKVHMAKLWLSSWLNSANLPCY